DARAARTDPAIENVLEINDVRARIETRLRVHAVVGGNGNGAAASLELGEVAVHHAVEGIRIGRARRVLVLDEVRGREIHDIRTRGAHEFHTRGEDELRELGAVHARHRQAYELEHRL